MAISVFPDRMNRTDPENPDESIRTIDNYIRYMVDQIEFALTNSFRTVNGLGVSGEELKLVLNQAVNDLSALSSTVVEVSTEVQGKVDKVEGKGLSTNDYTDAEKTKLTGIESGAQPNVIEIVKRNGTALTPDANKAVDVTVPVNVSDLDNDSGFQTAAQVQNAVGAAVNPILSTAVTYGPSALVTFDGGVDGMPLKRCLIRIDTVQTGSGDPSQTNVRPISGWTGANLVVSPTTVAGDGTTYPVSWQTETGTVYGGTVDVLTGELTVTEVCHNLTGTESWGLSTSSGYRRFTRALSAMGWEACATGQTSEIFSSHFAQASATAIKTASFGAFRFSGDGYLVLADNGSVMQDRAALNAWIQAQTDPVQFCYPLETPVTYQLSPQIITSLSGTNNIWADTGDVTVEYGAFLAALQAEIERLPDDLEDRVEDLEAVITQSGPILIQNAEDVTAAEGDDAIFSVRALGTNLTYKWELYYSSSWTYPNFQGRDTPNMTVPATASRNLYRFRCTITGGGWTIYSKTVTLHVTS